MITKRYLQDSTRLLIVSRRYSLDFHSLAKIVKKYIETGHYELYTAEMSKLCDYYESFVKQEIADVVTEALECYQHIGSVTSVTISENRIIMDYLEEE
jgi:hypothetical protein